MHIEVLLRASKVIAAYGTMVRVSMSVFIY